MRQVVIVSGVLGGGSALVFALAAVVASAFPNGTLVPTSWNGGWGGRELPPFGGPVVNGGPIMIDDSGGDIVMPDDAPPPDVAPGAGIEIR